MFVHKNCLIDTENTQNIENHDLHSSSPKAQQQPADSENLLDFVPNSLDPEVSEDTKNHENPDQTKEQPTDTENSEKTS